MFFFFFGSLPTQFVFRTRIVIIIITTVYNPIMICTECLYSTSTFYLRYYFMYVHHGQTKRMNGMRRDVTRRFMIIIIICNKTVDKKKCIFETIRLYNIVDNHRCDRITAYSDLTAASSCGKRSSSRGVG